MISNIQMNNNEERRRRSLVAQLALLNISNENIQGLDPPSLIVIVIVIVIVKLSREKMKKKNI